jgi:ABC-2 type transport system ATP-binding protein
VGIINKGKLLAQDSVENLRRKTGIGMKLKIVLTQPDKRVVAALQKMSSIQDVKVDGQKMTIYTSVKDEVRPQIIDTIIKSGGQILSFNLKEVSLEEILFQVVEEGV